MNIYSKIFFKDFFELLSEYNLYRLLGDGMIPITRYEPILCEIFGYHNIIARRKVDEQQTN